MLSEKITSRRHNWSLSNDDRRGEGISRVGTRFEFWFSQEGKREKRGCAGDTAVYVPLRSLDLLQNSVECCGRYVATDLRVVPVAGFSIERCEHIVGDGCRLQEVLHPCSASRRRCRRFAHDIPHTERRGRRPLQADSCDAASAWRVHAYDCIT